MIPASEPEPASARRVESRFSRRLAYSTELLGLAFLLSMTGCVSTRQSWRDWQLDHDHRIANLNVPIPPTPVPTIGNNDLVLAPRYEIGDGARVLPGFDLRMRNPDFPRTYIEAVHINLSAPTNGVVIRWTGPMASTGPVGPWPLSPGRGKDSMDCDDVETSNTVNSLCTPKGAFPVAGFADHLEQTPICRYATWVVHAPRYIAIHSHPEIPSIPASSGCVRVPYEAAKLIHNNSIVGVTIISITGTWQAVPRETPELLVRQTDRRTEFK